MTSFRVTDEQLEVAGGQVRCGYCMNVFMGRDYLISGGDSGDTADEDVLRSLLDPENPAPDDAEELIGDDPAIAESDVIDSPSVGDADALMSGIDLKIESAYNTDDPLHDDIEPDVQLLEGNLKFDEDDLRTSTDEDWALALLAELDRPNEDADKAEGSEGETTGGEASDTWDPLREMLEPASKPAPPVEAPEPRAKSKPGLGFEEIVVDVVPSGNDELVAAFEADAAQPRYGSTDSSTAPANESEQVPEPLPESLPEPVVGHVLDHDVETPSAKQNPDEELQLAPEIDAIESVSAKRSASEAVSSGSTATTQQNKNVWGVGDEAADSEYTSLSDVLKADEDFPAPQGNESSPASSVANTSLYEDASSVYGFQQGADQAAEQEATDDENKLVKALLDGAAEHQERREHMEGERVDRRQTDFLPQHIDLDAEQQSHIPEPRPIQWRWLAAAFAMVGLLGLQYVYFYWGDLISSSKARPALASVCNVVGCELPPFRDIGNIKVEKHVMRMHAEVDEAMTVDIIIRNKAKLPQPFPILQLTFSDMNNLPVATRKFFPNEYLDGELRGLSEMPSGSPVRLSLHVMGPGPDATNWKLDPLPSL